MYVPDSAKLSDITVNADVVELYSTLPVQLAARIAPPGIMITTRLLLKSHAPVATWFWLKRVTFSPTAIGFSEADMA